MSNTPAPTPTAPSTTPPSASGGSAPRQRQARGVSPEFQDFAQQQAQYITAVAGNPNLFIYTGQDLVDRQGVVRRKAYDPSEAYSVLAGLGDQRKAYLNRLYQLGVYGRQKPSASGLEDKDINAMADLLLASNSYGYTFDVALELASAEMGKKTSGTGGRRFRPTPKQDLQTVFQNVSQQVLGRNLSSQEAQRFVKAYQGMERTEAYGGTRAASADVVAEQMVGEIAPEETAAVGALTLASAFDDFVKGLA